MVDDEPPAPGPDRRRPRADELVPVPGAATHHRRERSPVDQVDRLGEADLIARYRAICIQPVGPIQAQIPVTEPLGEDDTVADVGMIAESHELEVPKVLSSRCSEAAPGLGVGREHHQELIADSREARVVHVIDVLAAAFQALDPHRLGPHVEHAPVSALGHDEVRAAAACLDAQHEHVAAVPVDGTRVEHGRRIDDLGWHRRDVSHRDDRIIRAADQWSHRFSLPPGL